MKLQHVYKSVDMIDGGILLDAEVIGSREDLLALQDKLIDANDLLTIKFQRACIQNAIVPEVDQYGNTSLLYAQHGTYVFYAASTDVAQVLNDVASNILHLIE